MIKYLFVTINSIALFLYSLFFDGGVSITGNIPGNIKPGTEVAAEIVVKKGSLGGFAKLQIEVPEGITVKESDSKGASFTFASGIGKWIWTGIPSDAEFTIKFILAADASLSGAKTINAKYSYVENNNKQVIEMAPVEVMIGDGTTPVATNEGKTSETPKDQPTGTSGTETNTYSPLTANQEPSRSVSAVRSISKVSASEWNVDVRIKKGDIKGFARYSDNLPAGLSARSVKTAGSSFSVADNKIKFVWVNVPTNEEIEISYVLTGSPQPDAQLEGEFSYLEGNESKSAKVAAEKIPGIEASAVTTPTETAVSTTTSEGTPTTSVATTETKTEPVSNTGTETKTETKTEPVSNAVTETKTESVSNAATETTSGAETGAGTRGNGNIAYGVQIGAYTNANVTNKLLAKKHGISEPIRSEMAEGFTKFMVGKFDEYKSARNHRESVKGKGVNGAFVVAYNGPKRITVQEALMVSNQKWYR
jgi:hypothetical protein